MSKSLWNLLTEPLFRVRLADTPSTVSLSLPAVLAALSGKDVAAFSALQPHQSHAWHAFLVQLAVMALNKAGMATPPSDEPTWQTLLRGLTPEHDDDTPWCLVVADLTKPAFMQPPIPEKSFNDFKGPILEADRIDVLNTAKNHDIKMARIHQAEPDSWVYALMTLQTMQGFLGSGNYGIARMNGGYASRPNVGLCPGVDLGANFNRDCAVLLANRISICDNYNYRENDGVMLLWMEPWNGVEQLSLAHMDPYFLEICRRIRLKVDGDHVGAWLRPSQAARLLAKTQKGLVGDPWLPISKEGKETTSLTVSSGGFHYNLTRKLIFGKDHDKSPALCLHSIDRDKEMEFLARCLVRGQGKTEGYHERRIPIPARAKDIFSSPEQHEKMAARAESRVQDAATMNKKVLQPALLTLFQCAPEKINWKDRRADTWRSQFETLVDRDFFDRLWTEMAKDLEESQLCWRQFLLACGQKILAAAEKAVALPAARRYKAIAAGERVFNGAVRKQFSDLFAQTDEGDT